MLNYRIEPAVLAPYVPAATELDVFDGQTLVSMVGFRFLKTRVKGVPIPFHRNFDEINLRFYVRRKGPEGWRRGVVFIKEIVPRRAIAWVARTVYGENYVRHAMQSAVRYPTDSEPGEARYAWRDGGRTNTMAARFEGAPALPAPDSEASFIAEHYWGYARQRNGGTLEYEVAHPPWRVWHASEPAFDCDVARHYGQAFVEALSVAPTSAFVAEGSAISVFAGVAV